jgi:hypothetical protein
MVDMASEATPLYEHMPLDTMKQYIRLLDITQVDRAIHYFISIVELRSAPRFRALSYTWGPARPTISIFIDDEFIPDVTVGRYQVRANLFAFLQKDTILRGQKHAEYLWIDQICIDQSDVRFA